MTLARTLHPLRLSPCFMIPLLAGALAFATPAHAHNDGAAIAILADGVRYAYATAVEPDSGAVIVYADTRGNAVSLYAQRVDRHGRPMWAPGGVLVRTFPSSTFYLDGYLSDGVGGVLLCWNENRGATANDVILQRVLPDGTIGFGATGLVLCNATGDQGEARLAPGPSGTFYAVWKDNRVSSATADLYAQRFSLAGAVSFATNGVPINSATYRGSSFGGGGLPFLAPDLAGNLLVTWIPDGTRIPRAQKLSSAGSIMWGVNGVEFGVSSDYDGVITADGSGGGWIAFTHQISTSNYAYVQHITSAGALAFPAAGLSTGMYGANYTPYFFSMRNATTGCFIYASFYTGPNGNALERQEVNSAGTPLRASGGEYVCSNYAYGGQFYDTGDGVAMVAIPNPGNRRAYMEVQRFSLDGTARFPGEGVIVGRTSSIPALYQPNTIGVQGNVTVVPWTDPRYSTPTASVLQVFGQALDATGNPLWDDSELPTEQPVVDAPGDQGGSVRVRWDAGAADWPGAGIVDGYRVWRSVPGSVPAGASLASAAAEDSPFTAGSRTLMLHANAYWEMVAQEPAAQLASYALTAPTGQDSMTGASANEDFMVQAFDDSSHVWWSSVVSGHSVDNLAPAALTTAAGHYAGGATTLYWGGSSAADLCCYDVFRGSSAGFVPSAANKVGTTTDVTFVDTAEPSWYRIGARDIHGNLGGTVLVLPDGTTAVDPGTTPVEWSLRAHWRAGVNALALTLDVPEAGVGTLSLYDVTGRRLWSTPFRTGAATALAFNVDGQSAQLPPGVVFARAVTQSGRTLQARAIVLR